MKCSKCGAEINSMNHYFIPLKNGQKGVRLCIKCAKEDHIVSLV